MPDDLLAAFRRPGATPVAPAEPRPAAQNAPPGYRAFGVAEGATRPVRLDIRPKSGMAVARPYSGISEIAYDRDGYTGILLIFAGKLVKLRGRELQPVVEALVAGACEFLAELADDEEPPAGMPVIESIELMNPQARAPEGS